jgi:isoleucyl-tRNA synthetase
MLRFTFVSRVTTGSLPEKVFRHLITCLDNDSVDFDFQYCCCGQCKVDYVVAQTSDGEYLVVAEALREKVLGEDSKVLETIKGRDLEGTGYQSDHLTGLPSQKLMLQCTLSYLADFVTTEDGTGVVHEAPAFGAEDLALCRSYGLPVVNPVLPNGTFESDIPEVAGVFFKTADPRLVELLEEKGLAVPALAIRALLPTLLEMSHRADLLRTTVLVHQDH